MTASLATASCLIGGMLAIVHAPALLAPGHFRRMVQAFPRNEWVGWLLTAIALTWVALIVFQAPLGRFESLKPALYVVAPVSFLLIVLFLDELLAPRALGGLLLLAANPVLAAARWHTSELRLVVTVLVYLLIIAGMVLVLSPYRFRQAMGLWTRDVACCRVGGALGVLVGGAMIILGLRVY